MINQRANAPGRLRAVWIFLALATALSLTACGGGDSVGTGKLWGDTVWGQLEWGSDDWQGD